jgi:hypothetical protein
VRFRPSSTNQPLSKRCRLQSLSLLLMTVAGREAISPISDPEWEASSPQALVPNLMREAYFSAPPGGRAVSPRPMPSGLSGGSGIAPRLLAAAMVAGAGPAEEAIPVMVNPMCICPVLTPAATMDEDNR